MPRMGIHQHHQVIRKPCILDGRVLLIACGFDRLLQHFIYPGEIDVADQRRNHTALRNPFLPRRFQDHLEQPHHRIILHSLSHLL